MDWGTRRRPVGTGNMTVHDPYGDCETGCTHDLARGLLVDDLKRDGPYPETASLIGAQWLTALIESSARRQTGRVQT